MSAFQEPGKQWTFIRYNSDETDTGILPSVIGESNDFAYWRKKKRNRSGGTWVSRKFCLEHSTNRRRKTGNRGVPQPPKNFQSLGAVFTFVDRLTKEIDTGTLPSSYGVSNDFVTWHSKPSQLNGGCWRSRKFQKQQEKRRQSGKGRGGLLARFKYLLNRLNQEAVKLGYANPNSSPEQMQSEWLKQSGKCAACQGPITLRTENNIRGANYDHDHITGKSRGFIHARCNLAEGQLLRMNDEEFKNYIDWISKLHNRNKEN